MLRKPIIPTIEPAINYYFIKTNNGKYYDAYKSDEKVGMYHLVIDEKFQGDEHLLDITKEIYGSKKTNHLKQFLFDLKNEDIVVIPNKRNQMLSIGKIVSDFYFQEKGVFRKVKWLKDVDLKEINDKWFKLLHQENAIISLNGIASLIDRLLYSVYHKEELYHFILKVKQEKDILCKSLYGLYHLLFQERHDDIVVKMSVESPGIIELITSNLDIVANIIKLIEVLHLIHKYYEQIKSNRPLDDNEATHMLNEHHQTVKQYFLYEVEKLELEIPKIEEKSSL